MHCLACQSDLRPGARFCSACGTPAPSACAACGSPNASSARFCSACGRPLAASEAEPPPRPAAERRHLSVLFCDLVGSTALSARLDPEELRDLIAAYQASVTEAVRRFDGF